MMEEYTVRPARVEEAPLLARIKVDYVRSLYRGFLGAEYLRQLSEDAYCPRIREWLETGCYRLDVLESDGKVIGFIVYGAHPMEEGVGFIYEQALDPLCSMPEKTTLVAYAMEQLDQLGYGTVCLWTLKSNFRVRFLYESMGFRPDGAVRMDATDGVEVQIARYIYRFPGNG